MAEKEDDAAEPTTTIRIAVSVNADLSALGKIRQAPKGWLTDVLLRYAMPRVDLAIDEWKHKGAERAWQQRAEKDELDRSG